MKFTILSHAGLLVEHNATQIVIDPWIVGSCYWRSWWNFPEPDPNLIRSLKPDFIYLTHLHWDHFHGPSLRMFDPETTVLVPKVVTRRMVDDAHWLGFKNVVEIPHGDSIALNDDFTLTSYQFGIGVDSCAILKGGGITMMNANDTKLFGLPLQGILKHFPRPDFVLRSHSSATPLPYCIEDYEQRFPHTRTSEDYEEEFARFALYCRARYAIPFASNHCFLHKETQRFNSTVVTPFAAAEKCNLRAEEFGLSTRAVVMPPGSSWSQQEGFELTEFDYGDRAAYVDLLSQKYGEQLDRCYAQEAAAIGDFVRFEAYFRKLMSAVPKWMRSRFLRVVAFRVRQNERVRNWTVDFGAGAISESEAPPANAGVVITVAAHVINDCCEKKMFSVWSASKRLSIQLKRDSDWQSLSALLAVLDAYELDLLPLRRNFSPRALGIYLRRWRDAAEALRLAVRIKVLRRHFNYGETYPLGKPNPAT